MKHTPGPWKHRPCPKDNDPVQEQRFPFWIDGTNHMGRQFRCPVADIRGLDNSTTEANARLIAAAPELLEACKEALSAITHLPDRKRTLSIYNQDVRGNFTEAAHKMRRDMAEILHMAIGKATGE